jgi:hypothetical protein
MAFEFADNAIPRQRPNWRYSIDFFCFPLERPAGNTNCRESPVYEFIKKGKECKMLIGPKVPTCQNCRFYESEDDEMGECHRHAPRPILMSLIHGKSNPEIQWPSMYCKEFCGEFEERAATT